MAKLKQEEVLRYSKGRRSSTTVRNHYLNWRNQQDPPIPYRCDNPDCRFHNETLMWNGSPLNLVLDHKNGVSGDNRPKNLRFLCPNCNAQLPTHGGGNRGRVEQSTGGFAQIDEDGKRHHTLPIESGKFTTQGHDVELSHKKDKSRA